MDEQAPESELYEAPFLSIPMTVTRDTTAADVDLVNVAAQIPASVADTRGVDYFFSVSDGTTTSWWPGTSYGDGYQPVAGVRVGFHHTRVVDPPHLVHAPVLSAPALQDLTISTQVTCATEACDVDLVYTSELSAGPQSYRTRRLARTASTPLANGLRLETHTVTVPAAEVTTRGLAYALLAHDGYTSDAVPGTTYWGAYVPLEGGPIGGVEAGLDGNAPFVNVAETGAIAMLPVRVLEPPHPVIAPFVPLADTALSITVASNCATDSCVATIRWRQTGRRWNEATMAGSGDMAMQFTATIPAHDLAPGGLDLRVDVDDGFVTSSTGIIPVLVEPLVVPAVMVPAADTTVHTEQGCAPEDNSSCTTATFGSDPDLLVRRDVTLVSNALVRFDLSDLPGGAQVTRASLTVPGAGGTGVQVAPAATAWDEATASFETLPPFASAPVSESSVVLPASGQRLEGLVDPLDVTDNVEVSGVGASVSASSTTLGVFTELAPSTAVFDLTTVAQAWVDDPTANFGVVLVPPSLDNMAVTVDSREGASPPVLDLSYALPLERPTATVVSPAGGARVFADMPAVVEVDGGTLGLLGPVSLYLDDELVGTDAAAPYEFHR
ncbi:MAG: DNRLRE domain-containing protein [Acidimicrobiia bacterium]|nr:DNRLRE domain-containing protein [Acidimicrobiia bacterium]